MVAKANGLDLEIVYTKPPSELPDDYLKLNPLGKIPTFVGADGYELTEAIAIAIYSMNSTLLPSHLSFSLMMKRIINYSYPCLKISVEINFTF